MHAHHLFHLSLDPDPSNERTGELFGGTVGWWTVTIPPPVLPYPAHRCPQGHARLQRSAHPPRSLSISTQAWRALGRQCFALGETPTVLGGMDAGLGRKQAVRGRCLWIP